MSRRLGNAVVAVIVGGCVCGIVIALIAFAREKADRVRCKSNLWTLAMGVEYYQDSYKHYPPATQLHETLPPEKRVSWLIGMLHNFGVGGGEGATWPDLDRTKAWDDPRNFPLRMRDRKGPIGEMAEHYDFFCCDADPSYEQKLQRFQTSYVGLTGLGEDAARLPLTDPRAGFFGHDRKLRSGEITDGLSTTIMLAETGTNNGYWFQGGYPTARGLIPDQFPYVGELGQFSSHHRYRSFGLALGSSGGSNFGFADGSVRFITESVSPKVLEAAFTIRGGESITPFGEE